MKESNEGGFDLERWAFGLLTLALVCSLCLNVLLGVRLHRLKISVPREAARRLVTGTQLPPIEAAEVGGNPIELQYAGFPATVLYVFVSSCDWCERNMQSINALAEHLGKRYRFVGLSLTPFPRGLFSAAGTHLQFPAYDHVGPDLIDALHLGSTPETIVVSAQGIVVRDWKGAYVGRVRRDIESYFGVRLPLPTTGSSGSLSSGICPYCERYGELYSIGAHARIDGSLMQCTEHGWAPKGAAE